MYRNDDPPDYDPPEELILSHKKHRARKEYTCAWCSQPIKVGTVYERWSFVMPDGEFKCQKVHDTSTHCEIPF